MWCLSRVVECGWCVVVWCVVCCCCMLLCVVGGRCGACCRAYVWCWCRLMLHLMVVGGVWLCAVGCCCVLLMCVVAVDYRLCTVCCCL